MDKRLIWWHSDSGVLPTAWTVVGGGALQLPESGGLLVEDVSAVDPLYCMIQVFESDTGAGPVRDQDTIEVQIRCQGQANTAGWASGASGIGVAISDGSRVCLFSFGDRLRFVNPATGAIYYTDPRPFPWLGWNTIKITKRASEAWVVEMNGHLHIVIPYLLATALVTPPAYVAFGCFDPTGTATATFEQPEVGLNMALPSQGLVERLHSLFPVAVRERWTDVGRGLLRASVGVFQQGYEAIQGAWRDMTSAAETAGLPYSFTGKVLPNREAPAWTLTNPGQISIVRERVRIQGVGAAASATAFWDATMPTVSDYEHILGARVDSWEALPPTVDAWGRVGPYLQIDDMNRSITAHLIEDSGAWFWVLTDDTIGGGAFTEIGRRWQVGRFVSHTVDVRMFGRDVVVLMVNGQIVDRVSYSSFPLSMGPFPFGVIGVTSALGYFDFSHATAVRRLCDLTQRIGLISRCQERLIAPGGCERNDELEVWKRAQPCVNELRGTTRGMEIEIARLACCGTDVVVEQTRVEWFLDVTWPDITPIYLDAAGLFSDVFTEVCDGPSAWDPNELARYAATYLVPLSILELTYSICLSTALTGPNVTIPTETLLPVTSVSGFGVGDVVQVRTATGTSHEDASITSIVGLNVIVQPPLVGAYVAGSLLRKVLTTT
ncbi:MAG: hypothetical protein WC911_01995 [Thermoleophilia bacterium]